VHVIAPQLKRFPYQSSSASKLPRHRALAGTRPGPASGAALALRYLEAAQVVEAYRLARAGEACGRTGADAAGVVFCDLPLIGVFGAGVSTS